VSCCECCLSNPLQSLQYVVELELALEGVEWALLRLLLVLRELLAIMAVVAVAVAAAVLSEVCFVVATGQRYFLRWGLDPIRMRRMSMFRYLILLLSFCL